MRIVSIIAVIVVCFFCPATVHASDTVSSEIDISGELSALLEGLPKSVKDEFAGTLTDADGVTDIRDKFRFSSVFDQLFTALSNAWPSAGSLLIRLFGLILIAGVFAQLQEVYASPSLVSAFSFCSALVFALALTDSVTAVLNNAQEFLQTLTAIASALAPVAAALLAASGQVTFAAVTNASWMFLFSLFESIGSVFLLPIVRVCYCLGIVGAVAKETRVESVTKCVRKIFSVIMTFLMLTVSFVIGIQSVLARSADSFSLKTVKFALGNMIPLIGGALSDAISTVSTSLGVIRSAAGGICVFALLVFLLPIIVQILLHRLALTVCAAAADMIGCATESKLISEVNAALGYILAIVAFSAALFLFVLSLFVLVGGNV